jgi:hypothetical protein
MGRHSGARLLPILVLTGSVLAQTVVPITSEPDHHLVISNEYVRVFKVEVPPKADTLYHQHDYDYLYVAIGDADVTSTRLHEKPVEVRLKDGEVELSRAPFAHKATNNSEQPFRNVTIEVLGGTGDSVCVNSGDGCGMFTCQGPNGSLVCQGSVLHTQRVSAMQVRLDGHSGIGPFVCPCLLVAYSRAKLTQLSQNSTQDISAKPGEAVWIAQPEAKFENLGASAKFILFNFSRAKMQ